MKNLILLLPFLLIQCAPDKSNETILINCHTDQVGETTFSDIVSNYEMVPLEALNESLISNIRKMDFKRNKFFILQSGMGSPHQILIFDSNGKFESAINSQGKGPQEYLSISDYDVHPVKDYLSLVDPGNRKTINYSFTGEFIDSYQFSHWIKTMRYFKNPGERILFDTQISKANEADNYELLLTDEKMNIVNKYYPFLPEDAIGMGMGNGYHVYPLDGGKQGYHRPYTDSIYYINNVGKQELAYKLSFKNEPLPHSKIMDLMRNKLTGNYTLFINYFENNDHLVISFQSDKKGYFTVYEKATGKSATVAAPVDPSCNCGSAINIVGVSEDEMIVSPDITQVDGVL